MDGDDAFEETVMLTRRARRARAAQAPVAGTAAENGAVDERTVVMQRRVDLDPATADTVAAPPPRRDAEEPAQAIYRPRPAPLVPSRPPVAAGGVAATRDTAAVTASVLRRSRKAGVLAVVAVGTACVVSIAGLVTLGFVLLG